MDDFVAKRFEPAEDVIPHHVESKAAKEVLVAPPVPPNSVGRGSAPTAPGRSSVAMARAKFGGGTTSAPKHVSMAPRRSPSVSGGTPAAAGVSVMGRGSVLAAASRYLSALMWCVMRLMT